MNRSWGNDELANQMNSKGDVNVSDGEINKTPNNLGSSSGIPSIALILTITTSGVMTGLQSESLAR